MAVEEEFGVSDDLVELTDIAPHEMPPGTVWQNEGKFPAGVCG
jgi:hypothetical protein